MFDKKSIERISQTVRIVERSSKGPNNNKRFEYLGGGGSTSAIFRIDADLPPRAGNVLGSASLSKIKISDGEISVGDPDDVYNMSTSAITAFVTGSSPEDCVVSFDDYQYCICHNISGHWIAMLVLDFSDVVVNTNFVVGSSIEIEQKKVRVIGVADCDPLTVGTTTCP